MITVSVIDRAEVPEVVEHVARVLAEFGLEFGVGSETDEAVRNLPASYLDHGGAFWVARDVDGDGLDDIIIGAAEADPAGDSSGRSYVVFGVPIGDNCCSAHGRGGCTDDAIEACVCEVDAACCTAEWDATCVGEATVDCGACG